LYTDLNGRKYPLFGEHPVFYYCYHRFTLYRFLLLRIYAMTALTRAYLRIFLDLISAGVWHILAREQCSFSLWETVLLGSLCLFVLYWVAYICQAIELFLDYTIRQRFPNTQQSRFLTACRRLEKLVLPSVFDTSFILDDVKLAASYPTTVLNEIMWHLAGQNILLPLLHISRWSRLATSGPMSLVAFYVHVG